MIRRAIGALIAVIGLSAAAANANLTSLVGDKDCFGIPGASSCPDGSGFVSTLGGAFFTDYRTAGDPAFTDIWSAPGSVSYTHSYVVPLGAVSASVELRIAGIHDVNLATVYTVFFDGIAIGVIPPNLAANAFEEVLTYSFAVPVALLTGNDTLSWSGTNVGGIGDGYAIDYSQLTIATTPEPSTLLLLALGAAALGVARRRPHS